MFRIVQFCLVVSFVPSAFAKTNENCELLLTRPASEMAYAASDFEGLFLHLIEKVQTAPAVEDARMDKFIRDVLNTKAELLNRMKGMMGLALQSPNRSEKVKVIRSIATMLSTLGIPLEVYGIHLKDGKIGVPQFSTEVDDETPLEFNSNPIGFLPNQNASERDLAKGLHRSIGYSSQTISIDHAPARKGGKIRVESVPEEPNSMLIRDPETKQTFVVNVHVLRAMSARLDGYALQLGYNQAIGEWVVVSENLTNPSGKMGF